MLRVVLFVITADIIRLSLLIYRYRYRKICVPLGKQISQGMAKLLCLMFLIISLVLSRPAPVLYGHNSVTTTNPNITGVRCFTEDKFKETKYQAYFNAALILVALGFFGLLVVLYSLIGRTIRNTSALEAPPQLRCHPT